MDNRAAVAVLDDDARRLGAVEIDLETQPSWPRMGSGPGKGLAVIGAGIVAIFLASTGLYSGSSSGGGGGRTPASPQTRLTETVASPAAASPVPPTVTVGRVTYAPGQASSWHMHTGVHAVEVLDGTITVYDQLCNAHRYGPGQSYIGGTEEHMASNETDAPVDMVVTDVIPGGSSMANFVIALPEPDACLLAEHGSPTANTADG